MSIFGKPTAQNHSQKLVIRIVLLFLCLYCIAISIWLLALPRDPSVYPLLGIPFRRILMIGISLLLAGLWSIPLALSYRKPAIFSKLERSLRDWLVRDGHWRLVFSAAVLVFSFCGLWLFVLSQNSFFVFAPPPKPDFNPHIRAVNQAWMQTKPILALYQPLVLLAFGISAVFSALIPVIHFGPAELHQIFRKQKVYTIAGVFLLILLLWGTLGWTSIQLEQDYSTFGWYTLGAPILDSQGFLVFLLGFTLLSVGYFVRVWSPSLVERLSRMLAKKDRADLLIALIIWVAAAVYWNSFPTLTNWFVSGPSYPNYSVYPNSDSITYDTTAQSLLVGADYQSGMLAFPRRPLYALFLAVLYQLTGPDFELLTHAQAAIFGVFPALIYLTASKLHSRLAGLAAAVLVVLREGNAIALVNRITISTSRMMMSEMPAAVLMALALLLAVNWFRQSHNKPLTALWIGGVVAASMLVRIEAAIFLFVFILASLIAQLRKLSSWFVTLGMLILGAVLFLSPWLWRNWQKTGSIFIEQPGERLEYITARTGIAGSDSGGTPLPEDDLTSPPAIEPANPQPSESSGARVRAGALGQFFERFRYNYLNNYLQAMLIFPDAFRLLDSAASLTVRPDINAFSEACCDRFNYYNRLPFWSWGLWQGEIPNQAAIPVAFTLLLLAIGFVRLNERAGIWGLFPFALIAAHYLTVSMLNISGGRFVQMLDWIWIIYFSVGIAAMIEFGFEFFGRRASRFFCQPVKLQPEESSPHASRLGVLPLTMTAASIFLLGAVIPLAANLTPPRYTPETQKAWFQELLASSEIQTNYPGIQTALQNQAANNILVLQGRALYPRYHLEFKGEPGSNETPFTAKDFARFSFFLVGPQNWGILLPIDYAPLTDFPHASDVLVIGCQDQGYVRAAAVYNRSTGSILLSTERDQLTVCPALP